MNEESTDKLQDAHNTVTSTYLDLLYNNTILSSKIIYILHTVLQDCRAGVCVSYREPVMNFSFKLSKRAYGSYTLKQFIPQLCPVITERSFTIICSWFWYK